MRGFLEKLTLEPDGVMPADLAPLRAVGLSDETIEDAIHVCALFNTIDRVADTRDFGVPGPDVLAESARYSCSEAIDDPPGTGGPTVAIFDRGPTRVPVRRFHGPT